MYIMYNKYKYLERLKRSHCRWTFSWRTIQQLGALWSIYYTRLCLCLRAERSVALDQL